MTFRLSSVAITLADALARRYTLSTVTASAGLRRLFPQSSLTLSVRVTLIKDAVGIFDLHHSPLRLHI